jgi:hypothetical protein
MDAFHQTDISHPSIAATAHLRSFSDLSPDSAFRIEREASPAVSKSIVFRNNSGNLNLAE